MPLLRRSGGRTQSRAQRRQQHLTDARPMSAEHNNNRGPRGRLNVISSGASATSLAPTQQSGSAAAGGACLRTAPHSCGGTGTEAWRLSRCLTLRRPPRPACFTVAEG